jgi:cold shock CspA family protein
MLFDGRAIDAHIKKLQGVIKAPSPPRRERRKYSEERISRMGVHQGTCSYFDEVRNFGFIAADAPTLAGGRDLFCAGAMLRRCGLKRLKKGDRVPFDIAPSRRHPGKFEAQNIAIIEREAA